jgi:hypothetical protein
LQAGEEEREGESVMMARERNTATTSSLRNVKEQFTIFGASGALVFGLLTRLVLAVTVPRDGTRSRTMNVERTGRSTLAADVAT